MSTTNTDKNHDCWLSETEHPGSFADDDEMALPIRCKLQPDLSRLSRKQISSLLQIIFL